MSKYKKVPNHTGIRKVISNGKYESIKSIKGKLYSQTFSKLKDAIHWRNTFNPFGQKEEKVTLSFHELWMRYEEIHFASIERSTRGIKQQKVRVFRPYIDDINIYDLTPDYIDHMLKSCKSEAKKNKQSKRYNFDKPLDELKAVFSWYRENYDYKFHNPILKRHYSLGIIRNTIKKDKVLNQEQVVNFIRAIENPIFQDFAIIQFFSAARFGEIAGIQLKNIDLQHQSLLIKEVVVEDQSKKFLELKPYPKNGHPRVVAISSNMFEAAILRRLNELTEGSNYLFNKDGKPLRYRHVQYQYNKAFKAIGLFPQFSGTHFMRYTMATESRRVMGSLDAVQSITGHYTARMANHYAKIPTTLQSDTVKKVGTDMERCFKKLEQLPIIS